MAEESDLGLPSDGEIKQQIFKIVKNHVEGRDDLDHLTPKMIRSRLVSLFGLQEGGLDYKKSFIKTQAQEAFDQVQPSQSDTQIHHKHHSNTNAVHSSSPDKNKSKPVKKREQVQVDSDGEKEQEQVEKDNEHKKKRTKLGSKKTTPSSPSLSSSPSPSKTRVTKTKTKKKKVEESEEEDASASQETLLGEEDQEDQSNATTLTSPHTPAKSTKASVASDPLNAPLSTQERLEDEEMYDDPNYAKKGKSKGKEVKVVDKSKGGSKDDGEDEEADEKEKKVEGKRGEKKPSKKANPDHFTRLKSIVAACGVRKQWKTLFSSCSSDSSSDVKQRISIVKNILAEELGMKGGFSLEKAKKIKEEREYRKELEDIGIQVGEKGQDGGARMARKRRSGGKMGNDDGDDEDDQEDNEEDGSKSMSNSKDKGVRKNSRILESEDEEASEEDHGVKKKPAASFKNSLAAFAAELNSDSE